MHNAQVSIESIIMISILMFTLLGAIILITQKMSDNKPIIDNTRNIAECHKISETISLVQSAEAITEQTISVSNSVRLIQNNIIMGDDETSCYYFGSVDGDDDLPGGVLLDNGKIKIRKDAGGTTYAEQVP